MPWLVAIAPKPRLTAVPRVLTGPLEIAGQIALTAHGLRLAGVPATAYAGGHPFAYGVGPDVTPARGPRRYAQVARLVASHDVVDFHFAASFLPERFGHVDARAIARSGRRVIATFWGSEIRRPSIELARNPHFVPFEGENDDRAERRLRRWASITGGHAIMPDVALADHAAPFFEHLHVSRAMVDTARYVPAPPDPKVERPLIVHSPTERAGKGTAFVRAAVQRLREQGAAFEYEEVTGTTQAEALRIYARADLVVDQLCAGAHGVFAIEAMSLAKPVLCHLIPEVRERLPADLPLIQADPDSVFDVLADWLGRGEDRRRTGLAGRAYAEREHDVRVVGARLAEIYARLS